MSEAAVVDATHKNLAMAFAAAALEFPEIPKDKENPHFKTRYSSFDAIKTACWPALLKHGIAPYHRIAQAEGQLIVTFVLEHVETGETDTSSCLKVPEGQTPQAIGMQITYLRRYTAAPRLGVCSDEDDDGNAASAKSKDNAPPRKTAAEPAKQLTTAEKIAQQKTPADLGSLLMAWVGKRPVTKHAKEWARIVSEAANHISGAGWPEDQVRPVLAVLNGIRKEVLDVDSKEAFGGDTPEPAKDPPPAEPAANPSPITMGERIARWLDSLATIQELRQALVSIDTSDKFAEFRAKPTDVLQLLRFVNTRTADRVAAQAWTSDEAAAVADDLVALETKYDLSAQAAAQFSGGEQP